MKLNPIFPIAVLMMAATIIGSAIGFGGLFWWGNDGDVSMPLIAILVAVSLVPTLTIQAVIVGGAALRYPLTDPEGN